MYTGQYRQLELFAQSESGKSGSIVITNLRTNTLTVWELPHVYGNWIKVPVDQETDYEIYPADCKVTFAYLSACENILDEGIQVLDIANGFKALDQAEFAAFIDNPYRESYHFSPVAGWNNDPNGLCWFQGYYHLYYQLNPFAQGWNNMYWGHVASKDLVHWVHLPVVLEPQTEILDTPAIKGGAFSGSALPMGDEVYFYLTRHIGPQEDGWATVQYQTMTTSKDMIHFTPEVEIIRDKPEGTNYDFRDPKVQRIGDKYYIVVGACVHDKATFLLYESDDARTWTYSHPLYVEETPMRTIECPDFFPLDGSYVLTGAWMDYHDEAGRFQPCRYYVGNWKGGKEPLEPQAQQWVDYGSNCYAAQTFEHDGRRILIGWISDFYGEHVAVSNGSYGSMTLPRELHVKGGRVYTTPVQEVYSLLGETLYEGTGTAARVENIAGNRYYAKVTFETPGDYDILLGEDGNRSIHLVSENGTVAFRMIGAGMRGFDGNEVVFPADVNGCTSAEIFVDGRTIEVYLNDGEDVGTRLFYNSNPDGAFALESSVPAAIKVAQMQSIR